MGGEQSPSRIRLRIGGAAFADDLVGLLVGPMFVTAEALFAMGIARPLLDEVERRAGPTVLRDLAHPAA